MADSGIYNVFKEDLLLGEVDLVDDTTKVTLYNDSHTFVAAATVYTTDNELATTGGYTQGGKTLTTPAVAGTTTQAWDADDVAWTDATFTAYNAVIYDSTNTNSLIATIGFGAKSVVAGTFTIQWDPTGIITIAG